MTLTFGEFETADDFLNTISEQTENTQFNGFSFALADNKNTIESLVTTTSDISFTDVDFYATVLSNQTQSGDFPPQAIAKQSDAVDLSDVLRLSLSINQFFIQVFDRDNKSDSEIIESYCEFVGLFMEDTNSDEIREEIESARDEFETDEVIEELSELFGVTDVPAVLLRTRIINQNLLSKTLQSLEYMPDNEPSVGDYLVFELEQPTKEEYEHIQEHMQNQGANKFRVDDTKEELPAELDFATETDRKFYRVICKVTDSQYNKSREYTEYDYYILAHNTDIQEYYPGHPLFKSETVIEPAVQSQYEIYPERPSGDIELVAESSIFQPNIEQLMGQLPRES